LAGHAERLAHHPDILNMALHGPHRIPHQVSQVSLCCLRLAFLRESSSRHRLRLTNFSGIQVLYFWPKLPVLGIHDFLVRIQICRSGSAPKYFQSWKLNLLLKSCGKILFCKNYFRKEIRTSD
jgi:hypothetical protein